jgi:raffinose/stachyose/melibiose transport system substrate-binding protein
MTTTLRRLSCLLIGATVVATAISGCASNSSTAGPVKLVWWHNQTADPGKTFWKTIADEYHAAHPNVTIDAQPLQNEQFQTKLPAAFQAGNPPDVFQQWGGGGENDQVKAAKLMDLTEASKSWIGSVGGAAAGWQVDGKQYGVPYSLGIVGFWYNKDLFTKAGISSPPANWDDFLADIQKLKSAGIAPIALGGKDRWPDAFYWDFLAVRMCSKQTMQQSQVKYEFTDPCWTQAGAKVQQLLATHPFQNGFLNAPQQTSSGLLLNNKAAMELMGQWEPAAMQGLTDDHKGMAPDKLGWFPFPSVGGGAGDPSAALGGGDGFSCSSKAPKECADFLKYIVSVDVQKRFAATNIGLPVAEGSASAVTDPNMKGVLDFKQKAAYVQLYLDQAYTASVGQAINDAIANQFAGVATPEQVVKAIADAATKR